MALSKLIASLFSQKKLDVHRRFELSRGAVSGTMSKFYLAEDRRTKETFGLKILDMQKTLALESRFKRLNKPVEGYIASQFKHPGIVETLEYGITTKDERYLLMEFVGGPGVNAVIGARDYLLDGKRFRFIRQAAESVAAVHDAEYIHRDICPRNLILTSDLENVKLIDFGLTVPATPDFMQPGNRTGTPNYMAPEVVRRRPVDKRLDVFAFGVTAYEIMTSQLPWRSGNTGMIAMLHDTEPPADIRKYRPQINPTLATAIHSCLLADVNQRCQSIKSFLEMIKGLDSEDAK